MNQNIERKYVIGSDENQKEFKYVALGDSLTYGVGASGYKSTYPYIFAQKFLTENKTIRVVNLALAGVTIDDLLINQLPEAIKEKPDFITLLIGTNDIHDFKDKHKFKSSLENIVNQLKINTKSRLLLISIPYLGSAELILFPYNTIMDIRIKEFNQIIKEVASETNVGYFDLYESSNRYFEKNPSLYSADGFHPSDKGYILWGNLINAN